MTSADLKETDSPVWAKVTSWWDLEECQLWTGDAEVFEDQYQTHSKLLDQHGNPIAYENPKLGFVGFIKLK